MITVNKTTWTDPNETMALHEHFFSVYGKDVAQPACNFCDRVTCYLVEDAPVRKDGAIRPKKKGVSFMIRISRSATLIKDDKTFIPVLMCERCSARSDAHECFKQGIRVCPDLKSRDMTEMEKIEYRKIFAYKIADLEREQTEKMTVSAKNYKI